MSIPNNKTNGPTVMRADIKEDVEDAVACELRLFIKYPIINRVPVTINENPIIVPVRLDAEFELTVHKIIITPTISNELYIIEYHLFSIFALPINIENIIYHFLSFLWRLLFICSPLTHLFDVEDP